MWNDDRASQIREMKVYGSIKSGAGEAAFLGMVRALEEGVNEFCVELTDRSPMCGEWRARFRPNGHDFDAEIVSFGYTDPRNVGNTSKKARQKFYRNEILKLEELIGKIFGSQDMRGEVFPFASKKAVFTGEIFYQKDWILEAE